MTAPRYWDGRVRQVLSSVSVMESGKVMSVETLSCGHEKVPHFGSRGRGGVDSAQFRLRWLCKPFAVEARP